MRTYALPFLFLLIAAIGCSSPPTVSVPSPTPTPTSSVGTLLERYTPTDLSRLNADSLALLARGWITAGQPERADIFLDELDDRGQSAFSFNFPWDAFGDGTINPVETNYTYTIVQVAQAQRLDGRPYQEALLALEQVPFEDSCWAYSDSEFDTGWCVHNVNALTAAFLSQIGGEYQAALEHERTSMIDGGTWYYAEPSPNLRVNDLGHQAWTAFELLNSPDPELRDLGQQAADWLYLHHETDDPHGLPAIVVGLIAGNFSEGCELAKTLPAWAQRQPPEDSLGHIFRRQISAAFAYTFAEVNC